MKRPLDKVFTLLCSFSCMFSIPFRFIKYIYFNLSFRHPVIALLLLITVLMPSMLFYIITCGGLYFLLSLTSKHFNNREFYLDMIENYRLNHNWELINNECKKEKIEFIDAFHEIVKQKKMFPKLEGTEFKNLKLQESREVEQLD